MKSRIGVVQMNSSDRFEDNLAFAKAQMEIAADDGVDLISFPETFLYIGENHAEKHRVAQTMDGELISQFRELAALHDLSILLGSVYEKTGDDDSRLYNTSVLIDRQGELAGVYRKIHMCDAPTLGYNESVGIKPGNEPVVADHEIAKMGLTVCYDLRFPELFRHLTEQGAEVIFVPAAFFLYTGKHHWLPLLTARAIENQVYIVAPNQWGKHHATRTSYGSSVIIDPWGSVICCAPEKPCLVTADIDLSYLREVRSSMPILQHRRKDLY